MSAGARKRFYALTVIVLLVTGLVTAALMQPVFGTREDFSAYNTRWNGASGLAADIYGTGGVVPAFGVNQNDDEVTLVHRSFADVDPDPATTSVLVVGPGRAPSPREAAWLEAYVANGGRLVVADAFGAGNAFLEAAGAASRFDGSLVLDLQFAKKPQFVVATDFTAHPLTAGVDEAVLDYATALQPGPDARVLARTAESAWLDRSGNLYPARGDPSGPFPWLAVEPVGDGEVLILSDPSVLINGMRELADNAALAGNVVDWLTEGGARAVLIDESHRTYTDPVRFMGVILRDLPSTWRVGLAFAALTAFLTFSVVDAAPLVRAPARWVRGLVDRVLPPPPEPEPDLARAVLARHPDWDAATVERVVQAWRDAGERKSG